MMRAVVVAIGGLGVGLALPGCGVPQSPECQQFVACQRDYEIAAGLEVSDTAAYQAEGDCWVNAELAATCTERCGPAVDQLRQAAEGANLPVESCD